MLADFIAWINYILNHCFLFIQLDKFWYFTFRPSILALVPGTYMLLPFSISWHKCRLTFVCDFCPRHFSKPHLNNFWDTSWHIFWVFCGNRNDRLSPLLPYNLTCDIEDILFNSCRIFTMCILCESCTVEPANPNQLGPPKIRIKRTIRQFLCK